MKKETGKERRYKGFLKALEEVFEVYFISKGSGGEMPSLQLGVTNCFMFFAADFFLDGLVRDLRAEQLDCTLCSQVRSKHRCPLAASHSCICTRSSRYAHLQPAASTCLIPSSPHPSRMPLLQLFSTQEKIPRLINDRRKTAPATSPG